MDLVYFLCSMFLQKSNGVETVKGCVTKACEIISWANSLFFQIYYMIRIRLVGSSDLKPDVVKVFKIWMMVLMRLLNNLSWQLKE